MHEYKIKKSRIGVVRAGNFEGKKKQNITSVAIYLSPVLQKLYCSTIDCPGDFIPIAEARTVACESNKCEVSQCCEIYCSSYTCPNGYTPIVDAATVKCADSGCATDLCCDFCECPPSNDITQISSFIGGGCEQLRY